MPITKDKKNSQNKGHQNYMHFAPKKEKKREGKKRKRRFNCTEALKISYLGLVWVKMGPVFHILEVKMVRPNF